MGHAYATCCYGLVYLLDSWLCLRSLIEVHLHLHLQLGPWGTGGGGCESAGGKRNIPAWSIIPCTSRHGSHTHGHTPVPPVPPLGAPTTATVPNTARLAPNQAPAPPLERRDRGNTKVHAAKQPHMSQRMVPVWVGKCIYVNELR